MVPRAKCLARPLCMQNSCSRSFIVASKVPMLSLHHDCPHSFIHSDRFFHAFPKQEMERLCMGQSTTATFWYAVDSVFCVLVRSAKSAGSSWLRSSHPGMNGHSCRKPLSEGTRFTPAATAYLGRLVRGNGQLRAEESEEAAARFSCSARGVA